MSKTPHLDEAIAQEEGRNAAYRQIAAEFDAVAANFRSLLVAARAANALDESVMLIVCISHTNAAARALREATR